ncbi:Mediator of RNA polymerase II transcription subunit 15a [Vitis vinifera]|uniref:Mediator of RNA polymerase II transcription subunit 15a n=1 Tax=Vitis vinifera TaxID=29760 RepID=A0A438F5C3_VITVI|nr:Mediator of RNA polymerase II transcription subunit 15a [Vitis vinifera]
MGTSQVHSNMQFLLVACLGQYEDLSEKAKLKLSTSLENILEPISLEQIARTWDDCARAVICEYAQQSGGGSFSTTYGTWENCLSAA